MYFTLTDEKRFAILASIVDLGGAASNEAVLDNIAKQQYLRFTDRELQFNPKRNEYQWRINLSYVRSPLVDDGFIDGQDWRYWQITRTGIDYLRYLALNILDNETQSFQKLTENAINRASREVGYRIGRRELNINTFILEHPSEILLSETSDISLNSLTTTYLREVITPYLDAISLLQSTISYLNRRSYGDQYIESLEEPVIIRSISQNSPLSITLEGASQAIQTIREIVVPWRREYSRQMAEVSVQEKIAEIEVKKCEILEKQANATKGKAEAEKLLAEASLQRETAMKLRLENERAQLELQRARFQLALDFVERLAPNLPSREKLQMAAQFLPPLTSIASSELTLREVG